MLRFTEPCDQEGMMSDEATVYEWGPFVVTRTGQPLDPFAVLYHETHQQSTKVRTARPEEIRQLLEHLEQEPQEGDLPDVCECLRRKAG
jgi:hypothetical protein